MTSRSQFRLLFGAVLMLLYAVLWFAMDRLQFPLRWDEHNFWAITRSFSQSWIPSWQQLRGYTAPNTPLPFLIFGWLERSFRGGIVAGRWLNFSLSFVIVGWIGLPKTSQDWRSVLSAVGLLLCPYYLFVSLHLYTELIPVGFVLLGIWLYFQNRTIASSVCFALAIAGRQSLVPFPLAIAIVEGHRILRSGEKRLHRWLAPTLAACTILGWISFYGDLVPPLAATETNLATRAPWVNSSPAPATAVLPVAPSSTPSSSPAPTPIANAPRPVNGFVPELFLDRSLYFLAALGLYYVLPEWLLWRQWRSWQRWHPRLTRKTTAIAAALLILFILFPPLQSKGILTQILEFLPNLVRLGSLYLLALVTCLRFARLDLTFWLVLLNAGILIRGYAWDKYVIPLLVVLWYLKSRERPRDSIQP